MGEKYYSEAVIWNVLCVVQICSRQRIPSVLAQVEYTMQRGGDEGSKIDSGFNVDLAVQFIFTNWWANL